MHNIAEDTPLQCTVRFDPFEESRGGVDVRPCGSGYGWLQTAFRDLAALRRWLDGASLRWIDLGSVFLLQAPGDRTVLEARARPIP